VEAIDELVAVAGADHSELIELLSLLLEESPAAPVPRAPNQAERTPTPISTPTPPCGPATGEVLADAGQSTPDAVPLVRTEQSLGDDRPIGSTPVDHGSTIPAAVEGAPQTRSAHRSVVDSAVRVDAEFRARSTQHLSLVTSELQVVRNAVDHGIGTPEARQATAKPEEDVLELRAHRRQRPARARCLPPLQHPAGELPPTGRRRAVPLGGPDVRRAPGRGGRQQSRRPGGPAAQDRPGHRDSRVPVGARGGRLPVWKAAYPGWSARIIGTDISPSMAQRAQAGHDSQLEVDRGMRAPFLGTYVQQVGRNRLVGQMSLPRGFLTLRGAESTLDLDGSFQRLELGKAVAFRHRGGAA